MTTFSGRDPEALTQEERFALFDLPLDIDTEDEGSEAEEAEEAEEPTPASVEALERDGVAEAVELLQDPEETEAPEPALDETETDEGLKTASEVAAEASPLTADETWKKRYDDLRATEMAALEKERKRAEDAEAQLVQLLQNRSQPKISEEQLQALAAEAEAAGLEPEQIAILAKIQAAANPPDDAMVNFLSQQAEEARTTAAQTLAAHEQQTLQSFRDDHPDLDPETMVETARLMYDVGAAEFFDANGNELPEEIPYEVKLQAVTDGYAVFQSWPPDKPLDRFMLEFSYEAVKDPHLRTVLVANPEYAHTDAGRAYAREQASFRAAQLGMTTLPTPAKVVTNEEIDAQLAAAETLGGTSGVEPVKSEPQFLEREPVHFSK